MSEKVSMMISMIIQYLKVFSISENNVVRSKEYNDNIPLKSLEIIFWRHNLRLIMFLIYENKIDIRICCSADNFLPYWLKQDIQPGDVENIIKKIKGSPAGEDLEKMGFEYCRIFADINAAYTAVPKDIFSDCRK
jgi:hypothetical protein